MTKVQTATKTRKYDEDQSGFVLSCFRGCAIGVTILFMSAPAAAATKAIKAGRLVDATGCLLMTLDVCLDRALRSWILSFGPFARVVAPASLAKEIAEQFEEARARYAS